MSAGCHPSNGPFTGCMGLTGPRSWLRPPHYQVNRDPASPHGAMASMGPRPSGFSSGSMTHEDPVPGYHPSRAGASSPYQFMQGMHHQQQPQMQQHQNLQQAGQYQIKQESGRQRPLAHPHFQQQQHQHQQPQHQPPQMYMQQQQQMEGQHLYQQPMQSAHRQHQHQHQQQHMSMPTHMGPHMDTYPGLPTQSSAGTARAPGIDIHITQVQHCMLLSGCISPAGAQMQSEAFTNKVLLALAELMQRRLSSRLHCTHVAVA